MTIRRDRIVMQGTRPAGASAVENLRALERGSPAFPRPDSSEEVRHPPAKKVQATAQAVTGHGEQRLEGGDGEGEEPADRGESDRKRHQPNRERGTPEDLREPRRVLMFGLGRTESREPDDPSPGGAVDRIPKAEGGARRNREHGNEDEERLVERDRQDQDHGGDSGPETVAAGVDHPGRRKGRRRSVRDG